MPAPDVGDVLYAFLPDVRVQLFVRDELVAQASPQRRGSR
jgi:hypothetical protein